MRVPVMFSDHGMFMFLYALMEMAASVSNIIRIAQITYEFVYYTLLVDQGRLFFSRDAADPLSNWNLQLCSRKVAR